jgi:hypothetical protein
MEPDGEDLRPGWESGPERQEDGTLRYWLGSGGHGIAGTGDGWWRVIDAAGRPVSEWSCFEGSQIRAEELEQRDASGAGSHGRP